MRNEELVVSYQLGDKKALETLINDNSGIVYKMARSLSSSIKVTSTNSIDFEDLVQEGYIGLMNAAKKYSADPKLDNRASFISYAYPCILRHMLKMITRRDTSKETSLYTKVYAGENDDIELIGCSGELDYDFENAEEKVFMKEIRDSLKKGMNEYLSLKQREILNLSYGMDGINSMIDKEIGELFGVSGSNIQAVRKYSLKKLKNSKWGVNEGKKLYEQL